MSTIELSGPLAKAFGKRHQRLVSTKAEAIRALYKTIDNFERYLNNSKRHGFTYAVFCGKENLGVDDLGYQLMEKL